MYDFDPVWQNMIKSLCIFLHMSKKSSNFAAALKNVMGARYARTAALAELVDAPDLGSGSARSESSSLLCRTKRVSDDPFLFLRELGMYAEG